MKKRMILLLLYCSLIAAQISNVSASETVTMALPRDPEITPCWNYISSVYSNLTNDNSGVATVYCYVNGKIGSTTRIEITADLQRYDNGRWITINRFAAASDSHRATGGFVKGHKTNNGDGTVPLWSASNNLAVGAATKVYAVNSNHLSLVTNNAAIALIKQFIRQSSSTSYTTALPDGVITDLSTNELGWLNATDNRRLVVTTDVEDELLITTSDGQRLVFNGNSIYDDEGVYWGSVWLLGNGSREYCLRFGNYEIETSANGGTITVAYMDDGFVDANKTYTVGVEQGSVYRFICSNESSFRVVVGEEK